MKEIVTLYEIEHEYSSFYGMRHVIVGGKVKPLRGYYEKYKHFDFVVVSKDGSTFPPPVYDEEDEISDEDWDEDDLSIKDDILTPHIWWWRR